MQKANTSCSDSARATHSSERSPQTNSWPRGATVLLMSSTHQPRMRAGEALPASRLTWPPPAERRHTLVQW